MRTKNAGSVFEQRHALARQRAHLRDEVRNRAGRACHGLALASFQSDRVSCAGSISPLTGQNCQSSQALHCARFLTILLPLPEL
ncbi:hypothetical protein F3I59_14450 [Pantoea sp. VH_8]|nr:hypothetical protein F3I59_14450 [Pantoea sp. VH_8]KAA5984194.1 hypothetical protein F3I49_15295 [Pantoea sp. M_4]